MKGGGGRKGERGREREREMTGYEPLREAIYQDIALRARMMHFIQSVQHYPSCHFHFPLTLMTNPVRTSEFPTPSEFPTKFPTHKPLNVPGHCAASKDDALHPVGAALPGDGRDRELLACHFLFLQILIANT